jgi:uncharacterized membrane protein YjfL (UPF0719 family)
MIKVILAVTIVKHNSLVEITIWILIGLMILALIFALSSDKNMKGGAGEIDDDPSEDWKQQ